MKFWEQSREVRQRVRRQWRRLTAEITVLKERESQLTNQLSFAKHERESRESELNKVNTEYPDISTAP